MFGKLISPSCLVLTLYLYAHLWPTCWLVPPTKESHFPELKTENRAVKYMPRNWRQRPGLFWARPSGAPASPRGGRGAPSTWEGSCLRPLTGRSVGTRGSGCPCLASVSLSCRFRDRGSWSVAAPASEAPGLQPGSVPLCAANGGRAWTQRDGGKGRGLPGSPTLPGLQHLRSLRGVLGRPPCPGY